MPKTNHDNPFIQQKTEEVVKVSKQFYQLSKNHAKHSTTFEANLLTWIQTTFMNFHLQNCLPKASQIQADDEDQQPDN